MLQEELKGKPLHTDLLRRYLISLFLDGLAQLVERVLLPQVEELQPGVGPAHQEDEVRDEGELQCVDLREGEDRNIHVHIQRLPGGGDREYLVPVTPVITISIDSSDNRSCL